MKFLNKLKWVLGILVVFILIITTNLIDRNNFKRVKESVETIYEDRLLAKEIIFNISNTIHVKEIAVIKNDTSFLKLQLPKLNADLQSQLASFEQTKLTAEEMKVFENLKSDIQKLTTLENEILSSGYKTTHSNTLNQQLIVIKADLKRLSEIQIAEGNRQMAISQKAIDSIELFTQLEIYFLVFLAIVIQIIVMYNPKQKD